MKNLIASLILVVTSLAAIAQEDNVLDYMNQQEAKLQPLGLEVSSFKQNFGSATVAFQQARIDSICNIIDRLWKTEFKKAPGYKGDNTYADAVKEMFKFLRADFKKNLRSKEKKLFDAEEGVTKEDLSPERREVFDHYSDLVVSYDNAVADYNAAKKKMENNFKEEVSKYMVTKTNQIVNYLENGLPEEVIEDSEVNIPFYGKMGKLKRGDDYVYVAYDFKFSNDPKTLYSNFNFLAEQMEKTEEHGFFKNTYAYGGQDAYLYPKGKCSSYVNVSCKEPWIGHLNFGEGLYGGAPYMSYKIYFEEKQKADEAD